MGNGIAVESGTTVTAEAAPGPPLLRKASLGRAAIYNRVSTDDQRANYSIATQLAACLYYVEAHGYALVGDRFVDRDTGRDRQPGNGGVPAFVDDFTSRELSRPGLDAALRYAEASGFDVLVVHALDRLARDPYVRQTLEMEFERRGVKVEYILGNYEQTPEGEVRKDLDSTFSKWETAKRVERCNRGKLGKARTGLYVGGRVPFGYRMDTSATGGLAVDESQATVVRRIFHLYTDERLSSRGIAQLLTSEKVPTALGGAPWAKSSIQRILHNQTYAGVAYYNTHKRKGKQLLRRDRAEWVEIPVTPLVDESMFAEAQRLLVSNGEARRRIPARFYLLGGMVFCSECGKAYVTQTARAGRNRRICDSQSYRHRAKEGHCRNHQVSARVLEPVVWERIVKLLLDPESLRQGYEDSLAQQQLAQSRQREHLETLRRAARQVTLKRQNLNAAYIDPDIRLSKEDYVVHKERLEKELSDILEEVTSIEAEFARVPTTAEIESLELFSQEISAGLRAEELKPEDKRKVLQMLHVRVIIEPSGMARLEGWFPCSGLSDTAL